MSELIASYISIVSRLGLSDEDAAAATGLAVGTARLVRLTRIPPKRRHCVSAIERFVMTYAQTQVRTDVRLAPRPSPSL